MTTQPTSIAPATPAGREAARRKLAALDKARLAWEILATYARVRWSLRSQELSDLASALRDGNPLPTSTTGDQILQGMRLGLIIRRTLGALPTDSRCLVSSLVLVSLLEKRGVETRLVIGVRPGPSFEAHAWVECGGYPVLPPGDAGFGRLVEV